MVRHWGALQILTWKCASRHNFSTLRSHQITGKTQCFATFLPFRAPVSCLYLLSSETLSFLVFFLLLFSSLTLPISAFHLSIVSEIWLLIPFDNHSCRIFPHFRKPPYRHPTINHPQRNEWKNHYWIYPLGAPQCGLTAFWTSPPGTDAWSYFCLAHRRWAKKLVKLWNCEKVSLHQHHR